MASKEYYNNCISEYRGQIADNNHTIEVLESKKIAVSNKQSENEEYLTERNTSISKLQYAKSEGVLVYGERLAPEVSYGKTSSILANYDNINAAIDRKIQRLREENAQLESKISSCKDEISRIEKEEQEEKEKQEKQKKDSKK